MTLPRGYLLDTNVVSEVRRSRADPNVRRFLNRQHTSLLYISALTLGELRKGLAKKLKTDPKNAALLEAWVNGIELSYADRVLPVNADIASLWGTLSAQRSRAIVDTLIAATALHHNLTLVTRNTSDVADTGATLFNPWSQA